MSWWKKLVGLDRNEVPARPQPEVDRPSGQVVTTPLVAFQPHNEIEQLLVVAANDVDARKGFERALLDATLYAATPDAPEIEGVRTTKAGEQLSLLNVQSPEGEPVAAIFTAQERIVEVFGIGTGFVAVRGEDLLSMVAGNGGAWLNPGFPYSVVWTADQLWAVLGKPVSRQMTKDTQIMLGVPANPPIALMEDIRGALSGDGRIAEAWFALAHWPEDGNSSWYLDVRTDLVPEDVQGLLAEAFKRANYAGQPLDMVINKPGAIQGAGIRLVPAQTH